MAAPTTPRNVSAMAIEDRRDAVDLLWEPNPEDDAVTGYHVWRSQTPSGALIRLNENPLTRPDFRDETAPYSSAFHWYYGVSAENAEGESQPSTLVPARTQFLGEMEFGPMDDFGRIRHPDRAARLPGFPQNEPDDERLSAWMHRGMKVVFREIRRRASWLVNVLQDPVDLYFMKWAGNRCPNCWTDDLGHRERCTVCFGTGVEGGYDLMPNVQMRMAPAADKLTWTENGLIQDKRPRAWTINWPLLHEGDLIVTQDGTRWLVSEVTRYATRGFFSRQECFIGKVEQPSILYHVNRQAVSG